jgi:hypothetical protein
MTLIRVSQQGVTSAEPEDTSTLAPQRTESAISRTLEHETVVLNVDEGHYYVLNETASAIWNLCDGRRLPSQIVRAICSEFDVPQDAALAAMARLFEDLNQAHLLSWACRAGANESLAPA